MVENLGCSKKGVNLCQITRRYILENSNLLLLTSIDPAIRNYLINVAHFVHIFISELGHLKNILK
jgi:hypothetical protein